jgi:hypothetical protein
MTGDSLTEEVYASADEDLRPTERFRETTLGDLQ